MEDIKESLRRLEDKISNIEVSTALNAKSLEDHMRRTEINEKRIHLVETWLLGVLTACAAGSIGVFVNMVIKS